MSYLPRLLMLLWLVHAAVSPACGEAVSPPAEEIVSSFVVLGDNQLGCEQMPPGEPTSANVAQLSQTWKDIASIEPRPAFIFTTGDMVLNRDDDGTSRLASRLSAWTDLTRRLARESGFDIPVVPAPGNKDILRVVFKEGRPVEDFDPESYPIWLQWLARSGAGRFGGNGPTEEPPNPDRLAGDNRHLTYSFEDQAGNHYILVDTFTVNNQPEPPRGWVPYRWIAEDARKAQANPRVRNIFAFGHMPIRIAGLPFDTNGLNSILGSDEHPLAQGLQETFASLGKFRAYFCGHLHLWDCSRLQGAGDVWQVIGGNAGSKPITRSAGDWQPPFFFGFNLVRVHTDGRVGVVSYRRDVPGPYYSGGSQPPARAQAEVFLTRPPAPRSSLGKARP